MAITEFKSRRKVKRIIYSPATVVLLVIVIFVLARATWSIYDKYHLSADRLDQAESQLAAIKAQEGDLSQSIAALSTASGTEAAMRTDFRIVKPGESLAVIVDAATTAPAAATSSEGFLDKVGGWFKGIF